MVNGMRSNRIAFLSICVALSLTVLYLACIVPGMRLALCAVAGLLMIAAVLRYGRKYALLAFVAVSVLAAIILPVKSVAMAYILLLGIYPIVKSLFEGLKLHVITQFVIKLVYFNGVSFFGIWLLRILGFLSANTIELAGGFAENLKLSVSSSFLAAIGLVAINVIFILYDVGLTSLIYSFSSRIKK